MNNIINLDQHRFPVGSNVWHKKYRVCLVVAQKNQLRTLKVLKLGSDSLAFEYVDVCANELEKLLYLKTKD